MGGWLCVVETNSIGYICCLWNLVTGHWTQQERLRAHPRGVHFHGQDPVLRVGDSGQPWRPVYCRDHEIPASRRNPAIRRVHGREDPGEKQWGADAGASKGGVSNRRVINFKFPLQPHQKHYITQCEEVGFSSVIYLLHLSELKVGRMYCEPGRERLFMKLLKWISVPENKWYRWSMLACSLTMFWV